MLGFGAILADRHFTMPEPADELLDQLLDLIDRLRGETEDFLDRPGDQQLWYNRGYANGMVSALLRLGVAGSLAPRVPDDPEAIAAQLTMPWGKAYRHGEEMSSRETFEITGNPSE
jgi:hypothetical protein